MTAAPASTPAAGAAPTATPVATPALPALPTLALGDDALVLSHRLGEWAGHAPVLEEEVALANIALDLLGQA
ncbi:Phenylacetic acid catabolic protein, partial [Streptomyces alboniger]|uniref:Phenylacetic acid catabolic protein n=1 Tax=Streptomyces alboniger TaxID=132473 RepID=UPI0018F869BD